jgi:hypothetical protein
MGLREKVEFSFSLSPKTISPSWKALGSCGAFAQTFRFRAIGTFARGIIGIKCS